MPAARSTGWSTDNRADIRAFARDGLPEIERFVREGRAAAEDIRALANSLREDPRSFCTSRPSAAWRSRGERQALSCAPWRW